MRFRKSLAMGLIVLSLTAYSGANAGPVASSAGEIAEFILAKFGKGAAGQTVEQVGEATAKTIARHGDGATPLLRSAGHGAIAALEQAGERAPAVISLFARRGQESLWVITDPKRLSMFLQYGDDAALALIRHPGIADSMIERFGANGAGALGAISKQNAQRLAIAEREGLLSASTRSPELLSVIRRHGDEAMDFIWRNKGALVVASALGMFLVDPQAYVSGANDLVGHAAQAVNWTLLIAGILLIGYFPTVVRSIALGLRAWRSHARS